MSDSLSTPRAVEELESAVRLDLAHVTAAFMEGVRLLEGLEESLRVLPTSQSRIRGWLNQVQHVVGVIGEEQADISRKLLGGETPPSIHAEVDHAHLEVVRAAKDDEEAA